MKKTALNNDQFFPLRNILIIDDDIDYADSMAEILQLKNYNVEIVNSFSEALEKIKTFKAHVALIDIMLGDGNGTDLIKPIKEINPEILCVIITAYAEIESAVKALHSGAYNYVYKPLNPDDLYLILDRAFERIQLSIEKKEALKQLEESNDFKELLLDIIFNDLKNSAGNIKNLTQYVLDKDEENKTVQLINSNSDNMLNIIQNTFTLSQIANGRSLQNFNVDFSKMLQQVLNDFKNHSLFSKFNVELNFPNKLMGHANPIISEIFRNYISTALKYGADAKRMIIEIEETHSFFIFKVINFGETIEAKDREGIFNRRAKQNINLVNDSGLGFSIVKKIANAQGGLVWLEPNEPSGNIFVFKLPKIEEDYSDH